MYDEFALTSEPVKIKGLVCTFAKICPRYKYVVRHPRHADMIANSATDFGTNAFGLLFPGG
jgi:hypothetical protein